MKKIKNPKKIWDVLEKDILLNDYYAKYDDRYSKNDIESEGEKYIEYSLDNFEEIIKNRLDLKSLDRKYPLTIETQVKGLEPVFRYSNYLFQQTLSLFELGFYEHCIISARWTLERFLHELIIHDDTDYFEKERKTIESEDHNPRLEKMIRKFNGLHKWSSGLFDQIMNIKNQGDYYIHHRTEMIFPDKNDKDLLWGVCKVTFGINGLQRLPDEESDRITKEMNRWRKARKEAIKLVESLFDLFDEYADKT